jgi:hypothetical protein
VKQKLGETDRQRQQGKDNHKGHERQKHKRSRGKHETETERSKATRHKKVIFWRRLETQYLVLQLDMVQWCVRKYTQGSLKIANSFDMFFLALSIAFSSSYGIIHLSYWEMSE